MCSHTLLLARSVCSRGRARKAVLVILFFSLVYNVTRFLEYRSNGYLIEATPLRMNEVYKTAYMTIMYYVNTLQNWAFI